MWNILWNKNFICYIIHHQFHVYKMWNINIHNILYIWNIYEIWSINVHIIYINMNLTYYIIYHQFYISEICNIKKNIYIYMNMEYIMCENWNLHLSTFSSKTWNWKFKSTSQQDCNLPFLSDRERNSCECDYVSIDRELRTFKEKREREREREREKNA